MPGWGEKDRDTKRKRCFFGGAVFENLPVHSGDMGSIPGQEAEIQHVPEHLKLCTASAEAQSTTAKT